MLNKSGLAIYFHRTIVLNGFLPLLYQGSPKFYSNRKKQLTLTSEALSAHVQSYERGF